MPGPFSLPVPLSPGESALALLTTVGVAGYSSPGGGILTVDHHTGSIERYGSSPLGDPDGPGWLWWNQLATLPIPQYVVTKIYAAGILNDNGQFGFSYLEYSKQGGAIDYWPFGEIDGTIYGNAGVFSGQANLLVASGAPAASLDLTQLKFRLRNESTISASGPPNEFVSLSAIGLVVYFTGIFGLVLGHALNCNDYSTAFAFGGANFAPGHGILLADDGSAFYTQRPYIITPGSGGGVSGGGGGGGGGGSLPVNSPLFLQPASSGADFLWIVISSPSPSYAGFALYQGDTDVHGNKWFYPAAGTATAPPTWQELYSIGDPNGLSGPGGLNLIPVNLWNQPVVGHWRWGNAITGSLTADLPAASGSDGVNSIAVDLSESNGILSATPSSPYEWQDGGTTAYGACAVAGGGAVLPYEFVFYTTAAPAIVNPPILRGKWSQAPNVGYSHVSGSRFAYLRYAPLQLPPGIFKISALVCGFDSIQNPRTSHWGVVPIDISGNPLTGAVQYFDYAAAAPAELYPTDIKYHVNNPGGNLVQVQADTGFMEYYPRLFTISAPGSLTTYYVYLVDAKYLGDYVVGSLVNGWTSVIDPGSGYAIGDTGSIDHLFAFWDNISATYQITGIDPATGGVTSFVLLTGGQNYGLSRSGIAGAEIFFPSGTTIPPFSTTNGGAQPGTGTGLTVASSSIGWGKNGFLESAPSIVALCTTDGSHVGAPGYIYMGSIDAIAAGGGTAHAGGNSITSSAIVLSQPSPTKIMLKGSGGTQSDCWAY